MFHLGSLQDHKTQKLIEEEDRKRAMTCKVGTFDSSCLRVKTTTCVHDGRHAQEEDGNPQEGKHTKTLTKYVSNVCVCVCVCVCVAT